MVDTGEPTGHPLNHGAESPHHFWTLCQSEAMSAIGVFLLAHAIINLLPITEKEQVSEVGAGPAGSTATQPRPR